MKKIYQFQHVQLKVVREAEAPLYAVKSSKDVFDFITGQMDWDRANGQEFAYLICLSRDNRVLAVHEVSVGGFNSTVLDPKVVYVTALLAAASAIIIVHNHPSGNLNPSHEDCRITKKLFEAGRNLDLPLIDHLIVTQQGYYSFADEGTLG